MQKSSDQDSETWRSMSQNLPVAAVTALVLPLLLSACPGSGQTEPTCRPQLIQTTVRDSLCHHGAHGKAASCPAPSWALLHLLPPKQHLKPANTFSHSCPCTGIMSCSKAPREGRGCFHLPVGWEQGDKLSLGDCPHQLLPYLSSSGLTSGCHHHHSSPPQTHPIWFSGSLCHRSHPPFPALSCLS